MEMPTEIPSWAWPVAAVVVVIGLIVWGYIEVRAYRARKAIDAAISSIAYEMLKNVLVPNGNGGQIHIHYLLLTQRGLLVLDLLDHPGAVFGGDQMIEWTVIGKKRRFTFANPQHALYDRMAAVRLLTGEVPVDGRVLFTLRSDFPKANRATSCASTISRTISRPSMQHAATSPLHSATSGPT
jgi:Nuclease-related domain